MVNAKAAANTLKHELPQAAEVTGTPIYTKIGHSIMPRSVIDNPQDYAVNMKYDEWIRRLMRSEPNDRDRRGQLRSCFTVTDMAAMHQALNMIGFLMNVDMLNRGAALDHDSDVRTSLQAGVEGIMTALLLICDPEELRRRGVLIDAIDIDRYIKP